MGKISKFDRLLGYIQDKKYSFAIKKAAAEQIGFLQQEFAYELSDLLKKLYPLLMACDFDTRCAAALAIRFLVPHCKPLRTEWKTNRPLLKLKDFDFNVVRKRNISLTHSEANHDKNADDYEKQIFEYDEKIKTAEFCQFSELLINQLSSPNWFYRHGAVIALNEVLSNLSTVPKDYLEDLATKLIMLVMCDRFVDMSVSDTVQLPVGQPACKLLARLLVLFNDQILRVLNELINDKDGWMIRYCAWLVIENISQIDADIFETDWIQENVLKIFEARSESEVALDDVISIALHAILPIVEKLPNPNAIGDAVIKKFMDYDNIAPYNAIMMKILQKLIETDTYSDFVTYDFIKQLFKMLSFGSSDAGSNDAREAGYNMMLTLLKHVELEVWGDVDMEQFSMSLIDVNIRETVHCRLASALFNEYSGVLELNGFDFREDYVVRMCTNLASKKEYLDRLPNAIAILINIAKYVNVDKEQPIFRGLNNAIAVCYVIILCLTIPTKRPSFSDINQRVFKTDPIPTFMDLFNFKLKHTEEMLTKICEIRHPAFRMFVTKYVGLELNNKKSEVSLEKLISLTMNYNDYFLPSELEDDSYSQTIVSVKMQMRNTPPAVLESILKIGTFMLPKNIYNEQTLLHAFFFISSGAELGEGPINQLVDLIFQVENAYAASLAAFVAKEYTKHHIDDFMVAFIPRLSKLDVLPVAVCEFIDLFLTDLQFNNVHWGSFFVPILLQNQAVPIERIRHYCSHSLAQIVHLLPLEKVGEAKIPESLAELKESSLQALRPLFDPTQIEPMEIKPKPNVELRDYQRNGVNWLGFLIKLGLNGILADDMGLGKTFQTLCAISTVHSEAIERAEALEDKSILNSPLTPDYPPVSLVVAPPNVVHHWYQEVQKFFPGMSAYAIESSDDFDQGKFMSHAGIVVTTYNFMVQFKEALEKRYFQFVVLDEGHLIKNEKTQRAGAAMRLRAQHRLILSGTPVQNDATDLWALFNFLMPGYLGTKQEFNKRYANVIDKMFDAKTKEIDTQKGQKALEDLHSKVLPFIMRRLKIDVLSSLPPKEYINQYTKMTKVQSEVYRKVLEENKDKDTFTKESLERQITIHPCLVDPSIECKLEHSGKLSALKDLLKSIGIGGSDESTAGSKAVIFCDSNTSIDMIIKLVIPALKNVTYTTYDSRLSQQQRNANIDNFQKENGPDLFLTTKAVASYGINLTAASNVILFELDWNPAIDLQASDRAHRIGQRKRVLVFQMILANSIDERIAESQERKKAIMDQLIHDQSSLEDLDNQGFLKNVAHDDDTPERELTLKEKINEDIKYGEDQYHQLE